MPGPASNPMKTNSRRCRTANVRGTIVELPPEGCDLPVPKMPAGRDWSKEERALWRNLWKSPQAVMWDDSFVPAVASYVIHTTAIYAGTAAAWTAQEHRHIGAQLGLTPQGMLSLGWVVRDGA